MSHRRKMDTNPSDELYIPEQNVTFKTFPIVCRNSTVSTSFLIHQKFGKYPVVLTCPFCKTTIKTKIRKVHPCLDFLCCLCCFCFCCAMKCKKKNHLCRQCGAYLGMYDK
ncbi:hypothetical protein ACKWTF_007942 [Chironomus riparius]